MYFLLPDAERWRRVLTTAAVLLVLSLLAWWPLAPLERLVGACLEPLTGALAVLAAPLVDALASPPELAPLPEHAAEGVAAWERRLGQPEEFRGVAWLEVPVFEHQRAAGRLVLAAGRSHGLALDQPVAFGGSWVGRVAAVSDGSAVVQLWTAPDARTGVWLQAGEERVQAVTLGVRAGSAPVVAWIDAGAEPRPGMEVRWRPRPGDPEGPDGALRLGVLEEAPHRLPLDPVWRVAGSFPEGAQGRVYVAAQAVGSSLVAEPPLQRSAARCLLPADAVLGTSSLCLRRSGPSAPAVVALQDGRVLGRVAAVRGGGLWVLREAPARWGEEAFRCDPDPQLYTRGGAGVPRGLPLGPPPLPRSGSALELLSRGSPEEELP